MNFRKRTGFCAAVLAFICAAGGCGSGNEVVNLPDNGKEVISLSFFGNKYEPENVTVIEEILSSFIEENPDIRVSYESLKGTEYYDALRKRMAAGKGDDVFMVNHDAVLELEAAGQLADLSGLDTISGFTDRMLGQMVEDGKIYWVPTSVSVFGLYCNMDLLKQHGQMLPENLEQWLAVCRYFMEREITPVIANNDISLKTLAIGRGFYAVYEENRQAEVMARLNSGEDKLSSYLSSGFALAEELIDSGYIDRQKALVTNKTSDDLEEFLRGESPFMLTGAWAAGRVRGMEPDFAFQVIPYPVLEDGNLLVINADTRLSVNADSSHLEAAMKFVEYFTRAENIGKFADQQSSFSPLMGGSPSSVAEIQPLIECYQSGRTVFGADGFLELPIWDLTAQVSVMLLSGNSLEESMEWLDGQTKSLGGNSEEKGQ